MTGLLALLYHHARITALGHIADTAYTVAAWAETTRDLTDDWHRINLDHEGHRP